MIKGDLLQRERRGKAQVINERETEREGEREETYWVSYFSLRGNRKKQRENSREARGVCFS